MFNFTEISTEDLERRCNFLKILIDGLNAVRITETDLRSLTNLHNGLSVAGQEFDSIEMELLNRKQITSE